MINYTLKYEYTISNKQGISLDIKYNMNKECIVDEEVWGKNHVCTLSELDSLSGVFF